MYFLSEICTGDGLSITEEAWRGIRFEVPFKMLSWPSQPRPSPKEWTTWQLFIKKAFLHRGLRLRSTLGHWTESDDCWEWYFSPSQECLFQTSQGTWKSYSQILRRNRLPLFFSQAHTQHPSPDLCRATIYTKGSRLVCTGYAPQIKECISRASSFSDFIRESNIGEKWCLEHLDLTGDGSHIAQAIMEGDAIAISDGSYQDTYGTASWVIEGQDSSGRLVGDVIVPGSASDQSAYRSELAGIYSILVTVKKVCEYFHILQGSIELGCDGQSALDKAFNYVSIIRIEDADHDLLHAIRNLWAHSPLIWKFRHVKGHQDDTIPIKDLDRWASLNVEMDTRAKQHMVVARRSPRHYTIAEESWSLWMQGKKIVQDLSSTVYDLVHFEEAREYWKAKDNISTDVINAINWDSIDTAMMETK